MSNSVSTGMNLGTMFNQATESLAADGKALQDKISTLSSQGEISPEDMLDIQFAMGQYNAKLEMTSSLTKSMQDMLKSLAQRSG